MPFRDIASCNTMMMAYHLFWHRGVALIPHASCSIECSREVQCLGMPLSTAM
uniref:Uncharacterized protein n=1 Tax=Arundo donax TaxID=35708 RepID=A0A0A9BWE2_ARUDO